MHRVQWRKRTKHRTCFTHAIKLLAAWCPNQGDVFVRQTAPLPTASALTERNPRNASVLDLFLSDLQPVRPLAGLPGSQTGLIGRPPLHALDCVPGPPPYESFEQQVGAAERPRYMQEAKYSTTQQLWWSCLRVRLTVKSGISQNIAHGLSQEPSALSRRGPLQDSQYCLDSCPQTPEAGVLGEALLVCGSRGTGLCAQCLGRMECLQPQRHESEAAISLCSTAAVPHRSCATGQLT